MMSNMQIRVFQSARPSASARLFAWLLEMRMELSRSGPMHREASFSFFSHSGSTDTEDVDGLGDKGFVSFPEGRNGVSLSTRVFCWFPIPRSSPSRFLCRRCRRRPQVSRRRCCPGGPRVHGEIAGRRGSGRLMDHGQCTRMKQLDCREVCSLFSSSWMPPPSGSRQSARLYS